MKNHLWRPLNHGARGKNIHLSPLSKPFSCSTQFFKCVVEEYIHTFDLTCRIGILNSCYIISKMIIGEMLLLNLVWLINKIIFVVENVWCICFF